MKLLLHTPNFYHLLKKKLKQNKVKFQLKKY